ncbi:hypothetical protein H0H92_015078 [Tricholoma furcatifolium]|nr:hypothetical protein H0H92_015078 [Tricholoma furcatifolium]
MSEERKIQPHKEYNGEADKFWSFYVTEADLYDSNRIGTWKSDLKNTLIFDPADVTNHLLTQLLAAQQSGATNTNSSVPLPSSVPVFPFKPSGSAIAVNILWFTSLVVTLGAALLCILFLQAVQHFSRRVQQQAEPLGRARVREFLSEGVQRWNVELLVNYIPTFLHVSLFLFFIGLIVFLADFCMSVATVVAVLVFALVIIYALATFAPLLDLASPFETLFLKASSRELSALNPDMSTPTSPSSLDANAFLWAFNTTTDDHKFETFLETVPGFLTSENGRATWEGVYPQPKVWGDKLSPSQSLQHRIGELLLTCSRTNYMAPDVSQRRALACIEALSSISQYERQNFPLRRTEQLAISKVSSYLTQAITTRKSSPLPITKGICAIAALDRQDLEARFYKKNREDPTRPHQSTFDWIRPSREADEALRDIVKMRHTLEAEFTRCQSHPEGYQVDIRNAAVDYLAKLEAHSRPLLNWKTTVLPLTAEIDWKKQHDLFKWYYMLPDESYSLTYRNEAPAGLYALQVMAFMRQIGAYAMLPAVTSVPFLNVQELDPALCQELEPFARLLTLLEPLTSNPIQISSKGIPGGDVYEVMIPPKQRPILLDHVGPFTTVGLILEDIKNGASVVTLIDLVMKFKSFAPHVVEPHVIREFLGDLFPKALEDENSDLLFVAAMRVILDWEALCNPGPCPFSPYDITFLLELLREVSSPLAVDTAARLFNPLSDSPDPNARPYRPKARMQAICNHIDAVRGSVVSRANQQVA